MFTHITAENAPHAYNEALWRLRPQAIKEDTRNGLVRRFPGPVLLEVKNPKERVLFDPIRDANPFFHIMEAVWMLAGSNKVQFLLTYNKRMDTWADNGLLRGAYGYRWRRHFKYDQLKALVTKLKSDPTTRQAVLQMYDAHVENHNAKDKPCNTHIYFEGRRGYLDMYVINRSNDLIWGMLGANIVHMTILQELVATLTNMSVGKYYVFSKNVHIYESVPRFKKIWHSTELHDPYRNLVSPLPIAEHIEYESFVRGCEAFVSTPGLTGVRWIDDVVWPMHLVWEAYQSGDTHRVAESRTHKIQATDWQLACDEWLKRRRDEKVQRDKKGGSS